MENLLTIFVFIIIVMSIFWKELEDAFLYIFIPELTEVKGVLVDATVEKKIIPFSLNTENINLPVDTDGGILVAYYYVRILETSSGDYLKIEVNLDVFKEMEKKLQSLDLQISLPCKKFAWDKDFLWAQ